MKIALAQIATVNGEIENNLAIHLQLISEAMTRGADLIIFPELSLTGYNVRQRAAELARPVEAPLWRPLIEASQGIDIFCGLIELGDDFRVFNTAAYLAGGALRHRHRKIYLPTYGRFDEARYFAPGDQVRAFDLWADASRAAKAAGRGRLRAGAAICEDLWHPSISWLLAQDGAQLLVAHASASDAEVSREGAEPSGISSWEKLAAASAIGGGAFIALANRVGEEEEFHYFGCSFIVNPRGEVVARARAYEEELLICEIDFDLLRQTRMAMPLLRDENLELTSRELDRIKRERFGL
jgi:predicted amidohydrolase